MKFPDKPAKGEKQNTIVKTKSVFRDISYNKVINFSVEYCLIE